MHVMVKYWVPVEAGNATIRNGRLEKILGQLLEDLKPESAATKSGGQGKHPRLS